jgi:hypothetical protein
MNEDLSELDLIGLLGKLEPIPAPPIVSLWPQTEAWVWIGLVVFGFATWLLRLVLLRHRANAYRRAALREIAAARENPAVLAEILRRTALAAFPRAEVAGLYGEEWLAFLDRTADGTGFREGPGRAFAHAAYREQTLETARLATFATRWVRRHRVDAKGAP